MKKITSFFLFLFYALISFAQKKNTSVREAHFAYEDSVFSVVYRSSSRIVDVEINEFNELTLTNLTSSVILDEEFNEILNVEHGEELNVNNSVFLDEEFYFGTDELGFNRTINLSFEEIININPDGPESNRIGFIDTFNNGLWVTFGNVDLFFTVALITETRVSGKEGEIWTNFTFYDVLGATDITDVVIDRKKEDHVYLSSFFGGFVELNQEEFILYDSTKSNADKDILTNTIDRRLVQLDKVFSKPVKPDNVNPLVTIEGLTAGANVKITDIEENLVFELQNETFSGLGSGIVQWNTKSFSGNRVSSEVYLILISDAEDVETSVEKLFIVC